MRVVAARRYRWLSALLVLVAAWAGSTAPARGDQPRLLELRSPAAGATLAAGAWTQLEWSPGPDLAAFPGAEEWEAFLSLDGGRSWSVRLTPHLDLGRRSVRVRLPDLPSDDARLLLRVGDERQEREQPVPWRFRIVGGARGTGGGPRGFGLRSLATGEPARPGDAGVASWAEGDRNGAGWREVHGRVAQSAFAPASVHPAGRRVPLAKLRRALPLPTAAARPSAPGNEPQATTPAVAPSRRPDAPSLAVLCRQNR